MIAEQMEFDLDPYSELEAFALLNPAPTPATAPTHCPRCETRVWRDLSNVLNCPACGWEGYSNMGRPSVQGLTTGSGLPTTYKPNKGAAPGGGYHRPHSKKGAGW